MSGKKAKELRRKGIVGRTNAVRLRIPADRLTRGVAVAGLMTGALAPTPASALWENLTNVSGNATITNTSKTSQQVDVFTGRYIGGLGSANIWANETVRVLQPNAASVALFRVAGQEATSIYGTLTANGQIFLQNPSGILFGSSSRVDVAALTATTLNITNQDFLTANYRFFQQPGAANAAVVNQGLITAGPGGYVALLGAAVRNEGVIVANLGSIAMAAGKAATLDMRGDGLIEFVVTEKVSGAVTGPNGETLASYVSNTGTLQADGGMVTLTAQAATDVIKSVVNNEGVIRAQSIVERNGKIFLSGGDEGIVTVAGTLDASGTGAGQTGGTVQVTGDKVGLFGANINVAGDAGGGTALIGGDLHGANAAVQNASATYMSANSTITADAITNGNGGKVVLWSNQYTNFQGKISAKGGSVSGDGGFVETSSKGNLQAFGSVDASAANGKGGTWLLDPRNVTIQDSEDTDFDNGSPTNTFTPTTDDSIASRIVIQNSLNAGTNVTITTGSTGGQDGNITVASSITKTGGADATLLLTAANDITVNNTISSTSGKLNVTLTANDANTGPTGAVSINAAITTLGGNFQATGKSISSSGAGTITTTASAGDSGWVNISATGTGANIINLAGDIDTRGANGSNSAGGKGGNVTISTTDGNISVANIYTSGGNADGHDGGTLNGYNGGDAGNVTIQITNATAARSITVNGAILAVGGDGSNGGDGEGGVIGLPGGPSGGLGGDGGNGQDGGQGGNGGNGGAVTLTIGGTGGGTISVAGLINASGGNAGNGGKGGDGGVGGAGGKGDDGETGSDTNTTGTQGSTGDPGTAGANGTSLSPDGQDGGQGGQGGMGATGDQGGSGFQGFGGGTGGKGGNGGAGGNGGIGGAGGAVAISVAGAGTIHLASVQTNGGIGGNAGNGGMGANGGDGGQGGNGGKGGTGGTGGQGGTGGTGGTGGDGFDDGEGHVGTGGTGGQGGTGGTGGDGGVGGTGGDGGYGGTAGAGGIGGAAGDAGNGGAAGTISISVGSGTVTVSGTLLSAVGPFGGAGTPGAGGYGGSSGSAGDPGTIGDFGFSGSPGGDGSLGGSPSGQFGGTGGDGGTGGIGGSGGSGGPGGSGGAGGVAANGTQNSGGGAGAGGLNGASGSITFVANTGNLAVVMDDFSTTNSITATGNQVTVAPYTANTLIRLGDGATNRVDFGSTNFLTSIITASGLGVGDANSGNITVAGHFNPGFSSLALATGGAIVTNTGGHITSTSLSASAVSGIGLGGANTVDSFSATNSTSGSISFTDTVSALTITGITNSGGNVIVSNTGSLAINGAINTTPAGSGQAGGSVSLTASVITSNGDGAITTTGTTGADGIPGTPFANPGSGGTGGAGGDVLLYATGSGGVTLGAAITANGGQGGTGGMILIPPFCFPFICTPSGGTGGSGGSGGTVTLLATTGPVQTNDIFSLGGVGGAGGTNPFGPNGSAGAPGARGTVQLSAAGDITQQGIASIHAGSFKIVSGGTVTLTDPDNDVQTLAADLTSGSGSFTYTNATPLTVGTVGSVSSLGQTIGSVNGITTASNGSISVHTYNGSLTVSRTISAAGIGTVTLTADGEGSDITINGSATVQSGTGLITLLADHNIVLDSSSASAAISTGGNVNLTATNGSINELLPSDPISANLLTTSSATGTTLNGANTVNSFTATNSTSNDISFTNAQDLTVTGIANSALGGAVSVTVTPNGTLTVTGNITTADVTSGASGAIVLFATGNVSIQNAQLTTGDSIVTAGNAQSGSILVTSTGGSITNVAGTHLTTGNATADGGTGFEIGASSGSITLNAAAEIRFASSHALKTGSATVTNADDGEDHASSGGISLTGSKISADGTTSPLSVVIGTATIDSPSFVLGQLSANTTSGGAGDAGGIFITSDSNLRLGAVTTAGGNINISTTGSGHDLTLNGAISTRFTGLNGSDVSGGSVTLTSGGGLSSTSGGTINTRGDDGEGGSDPAGSGGGVTLHAVDAVSLGAAITANGGNSSSSAGSGGIVTITSDNSSVTVHNITTRKGTGPIGTDGTIHLNASTTIGQQPTTALSGGLLTTSSGTGTTLTESNAVSSFNATNSTSGNIELTNTASPLTITGISNFASSGNVTVTNTGAVNTTGAITTANGSISLTANGAGITLGSGVVAGNAGSVTLTAGGAINGASNANYNTVTGTVTVGSGPYEGVAVSPDGTKAYVPNGGDNTVSVINTATGATIATVPVGSSPVFVAVSPDGTKAYVTNANSNTVSVINTATNSVTATVNVGALPEGIAVSPNGATAYVVNHSSNTVSVIDTATNSVAATVNVGANPWAVAVSPDGTKAYVTNTNSNTVSVISTASNSVTATVNVGVGPLGVAVSPDGTKAYVTNTTANTVSVINTASNSVTATVNVGSGPGGVAISPDGTRAYVPNQNTNTVSVISTASNSVTATVNVGVGPLGVAVSPDGTKAYVSNYSDNTVSVLDTNPGGTVRGGLLTTSSAGGTTLNAVNGITNQVTSFHATNSASGGISLTNTASTLTITGISNSNGGLVSVINTGSISVSGAVSTTGNGPITLTANGGGSDVYISALVSSNSGTITITANNDVELGLLGPPSPVMLLSSGGDISLTATNGMVKEVNGNEFINNTATETLTVHAATGIDLQGPNTVQSINFTNSDSGNITFNNTAAPLTIAGISQSGGGSVSVANAGTINISGNIAAANGAVSLTTAKASGGDINGGGGVISSSNSITLNADGGIGFGNTPVYTDLGTTGSLSLTTHGIGSAGNITIADQASYLQTSQIQVTFTDNTQPHTASFTGNGTIRIDTDFGVGSNNLTLAATNGGSIVNMAGIHTLTANDLRLDASSDIGSPSWPILTNISGNLAAQQTGLACNGIYITQTTGSLTIGTANGLDGIRTNGRPVEIEATTGTLAINQAITTTPAADGGSGGSVKLTADTITSNPLGTITTTGASGAAGAAGSYGFYDPGPGQTGGAGGDVLLRATGSSGITLNAPITANGGKGGKGGDGDYFQDGGAGGQGGNGGIVTLRADLGPIQINDINSLGGSGGPGGLGDQIFLSNVDGPSGTSGARGTVQISATGDITQGGVASIHAGSLKLVSGGNVTLDDADNDVQTLAADLSYGTGSLTYFNATPLTIGTVPQITSLGLTVGGVSGITTGSNGSINVHTFNGSLTISQLVSAGGTGAVTLTADGEGSDVYIAAKVSSGSGTINVTAAHDVEFGDPVGDLISTSGDVNLTATGGQINELGGFESIHAGGTLTTSSYSGTTLDGPNTVNYFHATNSTSGNISFTNAQALNVTGVTNSAPNAGITIHTTSGALTISGAVSATANGAVYLDGEGNDLAINAAVSSGSGTITLADFGTIMEDVKTGSVSTTGLLTSYSAAGTTLNGANQVGSFHATNITSGDISFTNTAATLMVTGITNSANGGSVTVVNTGSLSVTGVVSAVGSGAVSLTADGESADISVFDTTVSSGSGTITLLASRNITIDNGGGGHITTGGDVNLTATHGYILESTGADSISANALTTSSATGTTLDGPNTVNSFNASNSTSGSISFTNGQGLTVTGITNSANGGSVTVVNTGSINLTTDPVSTFNGQISLTANSSGNIQVDAGINSGSARTTLTAGGRIFGAATVTAHDLVLSAINGIDSDGAGSGAFQTNAIRLQAFNNSNGIAVTNSGAVDLANINGNNSGLAVSNTSSSIDITAGGSIAVSGNVSAGGASGVSLTANGSGSNITIQGVTVQSGSGTVTLLADHNVTIDKLTVSAGFINTTGNVNLTATNGAILEQTADDHITAGGTLTTSSKTGTDLSLGSNIVSNFQAANSTSGAISLSNGPALTISGTGVSNSAANGAVTITNTGPLKVTHDITSNGGDITLSGTGNSPTGFDAYGVSINAATVNAGAGSIGITGQSANAASGSVGVGIVGGGVVQTTSGDITIHGTNNSGAGGTAGFYIAGSGSKVTTASGAIHITGDYTGSASGDSNIGVWMEGGGGVSSTGAGTITITGTGGNGVHGNAGVLITGSGTKVASSGGAISIIGNRGNASNSDNIGLYIVSGGSVEYTGTGTGTRIALTGGGANPATFGNHGIIIDGATVSTSTSGDISLTGTASTAGTSGVGITLNSGAVVGSATSTGTITMTADTINLGSGSTTQTTGVVNLKQKTNGVAIRLGTDDGEGALGFTSAELDTITAGVIRIGDTNSGNISITAPFAAAHTDALSLQTAASISQNTGGSVVTSSLALQAASVIMGETNSVDTLAANVTGSTNAFTFTNNKTLSVGSVDGLTGVTTNGGIITLNTTNGGNVAINQAVSSGAAKIAIGSAGTISEGGGGSGLFLTTGLLQTTSTGGQTLTNSNTVGSFNAINLASGNVSLTDSTALIVTGINNGSRNVTLDANGAITQSGAITSGLLTTTSIGGTTLTSLNAVDSFNATNSKSGNISLTTETSTLAVTGVSQSGGGTVTLSNITGHLSVTGAISSTGSTGTVNLAATGNVALGADVTAGSVVQPANVLIQATGGAITQSAGTITGNGVLLDSGTGVGTMGTPIQTAAKTLAARTTTSGGVFITEADAVTVGTVGSGNGVSTASNGSIAVNAVSGTLTISQPVSADGIGTVTLTGGQAGTSIADVAVGAGVSSGTGTVTLTADRNITMTAGTVGTSGSVSLTSGVVGIGNVTESGTGKVSAPSLTVSSATGVTMANANTVPSLTITNSTSGAVSFTTTGALDVAAGGITNANGNVTLSTGGTVSQTGVLTGRTLTVSASAGNITLPTATNEMTTVNLSAPTGSVTYRDATAMVVSGITAGGNVTLTAGDGTGTGGGTITQTGAIVAGSWTLTAKTLNDNGSAITLTNTGNDVAGINLQTRNAADGANMASAISYRDATGFDVAGVQTGSTVTLTAGNAITQSGPIAGTTLTVKTLKDTGAGISLTSSTNELTTVNLKARNAADTANAAGDISYSDATGYAVSALTTTGNATLTAGGAITQSGAIVANLLTAKTLNDSGAAITLSNTGNDVAGINLQAHNAADNANAAGAITYRDVTGVDVAGIQTSSTVTLTAGGAITQSGAITGTTLTGKTLNDSGAGISLANPNNEFTTVSLKARNAADTANTAGDISYSDATGYAVSALNTTGNATLTAGGAITQSGAILANLLTAKTLNNTPAAITLSNTGNDVATINLQTRNANDTASVAGAITYTDANAVAIAQIATTGNITLTTTGAVTQTGSILGSSTGTTLKITTTGGTNGITLTDANNEVAIVTMTAPGAISYRDATGFGVGVGSVGITATSGAVTLTAGGAITNAAGATTSSTVSGTAVTLNASSVGTAAAPLRLGTITGDISGALTGTTDTNGFSITSPGVVHLGFINAQDNNGTGTRRDVIIVSTATTASGVPQIDVGSGSGTDIKAANVTFYAKTQIGTAGVPIVVDKTGTVNAGTTFGGAVAACAPAGTPKCFDPMPGEIAPWLLDPSLLGTTADAAIKPVVPVSRIADLIKSGMIQGGPVWMQNGYILAPKGEGHPADTFELISVEPGQMPIVKPQTPEAKKSAAAESIGELVLLSNGVLPSDRVWR